MPNNNELLITDSLVQYGDGLFETMIANKNKIYNFSYHQKRLNKGCEKLGINKPNFRSICIDILKQIQNKPSEFFSIKVIVSRGTSMRGYKTNLLQKENVFIQISNHSINYALYNGVSIGICKTELSKQPLLAGIKHCNRLEQIIAKRELTGTDFQDGLMSDTDGNVIEGISSNIFIVKNNTLYTPCLKYSGVSGTLRSQILNLYKNNNILVEIKNINLDDIAKADEVFLTNSILGILPVYAIDTIRDNFAIIASKKLITEINHPCSEKHTT